MGVFAVIFWLTPSNLIDFQTRWVYSRPLTEDDPNDPQSFTDYMYVTSEYTGNVYPAGG